MLVEFDMVLAGKPRQIPVILADNAGFDSAELAGQLRAAHAKGRLKVIKE